MLIIIVNLDKLLKDCYEWNHSLIRITSINILPVTQRTLQMFRWFISMVMVDPHQCKKISLVILILMKSLCVIVFQLSSLFLHNVIHLSFLCWSTYFLALSHTCCTGLYFVTLQYKYEWKQELLFYGIDGCLQHMYLHILVFKSVFK